MSRKNPPVRKPKHTPARIIAALKETKGRIFQVAQRLGVTSRTVRNYMERWPEVKEAIAEEKGLFVDMCETLLHGAALRGEPWAIKLVLERLGKDRGWNQKVELSHEGSMQQVHVYIPDNGRDPVAAACAGTLPAK
jgi:lambda repressor-like predicted transcriptional regulator